MARTVTYDYTCDTCGYSKTHVQTDSDYRQEKCPDCGKNTLRRLFPCPAFHTRYSPAHPRVNRGRGH